MSCYLWHVTDVLHQAGISVTRQNRKQIDQSIHQIVGVNYKSCPTAWKRVREEIRGDEQKRRAFASQLRRAVKKEFA